MTDIKYISVKIQGGLGNHLFQIAYGLYLSLKYNKSLVFKQDDFLENQHNLTRRTFYNTLFNNLLIVLKEERYNNIKFINYHEIQHSHFIEPSQIVLKENVLLIGYFQSFKYIDDNIREYMRNLVYSNKEIFYKAYDNYILIKEYFKNINNITTEDDDIVSIHIRRTDYIQLQHYFGNCNEEYYKKAYDIVNRKNVVIFSDDIKWCKENMERILENKNIYFVDINDVSIEFILMSLIKHNIISNSTFSLWSSFISYYDSKKTIIAPKKWYSDDNSIKDWDELYHKYITHII